jgi:frizzled protein 5/8
MANLLVGLLVTSLVAGAIYADSSYKPKSKCTEITLHMCRDIGYNLTSFPNAMGHQSQDDAALEIHQFWPLVKVNCSPDLKFFLCSIYTPLCLEEYTRPFPVCRSVCERARDGCAPLMLRFSFAWPQTMSCEKFPNNLCMEDGMWRPSTQSNTESSPVVV